MHKTCGNFTLRAEHGSLSIKAEFGSSHEFHVNKGELNDLLDLKYLVDRAVTELQIEEDRRNRDN